MYKEALEKIIKKEKEIFSNEELLDMMKEIIIKKSIENKDLDIELLRKNWKKAFTNGLTVLGMIQGMNHISSGFEEKITERQKSPAYQRGAELVRQSKLENKHSKKSPEESIEQARIDAKKEGDQIYQNRLKENKEKKPNLEPNTDLYAKNKQNK